MKTNSKLAGTGLLTAITASLCCITPILGLLAGTTGIASSFSWIEPFRPYLIGLTILVLGFAWYQQLKPKVQDDCCDTEEKPKFIQSRKFLGIVSVFSIIMLGFPYYSAVFYPKTEGAVTTETVAKLKKAEFMIEGMTCEGCEMGVNYKIEKLAGILTSTTSYATGNAVVEFDAEKTSISEIQETINSTGYLVTDVNTN